jgi:hypothetical protein
MVPGAIGCSGRMKFYVREFLRHFQKYSGLPGILQGRRLPDGRGDLKTVAQADLILKML